MNIGDKFGRWTVLEEPKRKYGGKVLCRCNCGTEKMVLKVNLIWNKTQSCGCLRRELMPKKAKAIQQAISPRVSVRRNSTGYKGVIDMTSSYQVKLAVGGFKTAEEAHECYVFLKEKAREYQDGTLSE
jgi:hypothetical protein